MNTTSKLVKAIKEYRKLNRGLPPKVESFDYHYEAEEDAHIWMWKGIEIYSARRGLANANDFRSDVEVAYQIFEQILETAITGYAIGYTDRRIETVRFLMTTEWEAPEA